MTLLDDLRKPLLEIVDLPPRPIDTITLDAHVWKEEHGKKRRSRAEATYDLDIVESFVPTPEIRDFIAEVFNKLAAKEGQGWWIQSEFGSGKSHLLAFLTIMLTCGSDEPWDILDRTERERENRGKAESLGQSHFRQIQKMDVFPIVCSLVGKGGKEVGSDREGKPLIDYIVEAAQDAFKDYWGDQEPLRAFPSELVVEQFRKNLSAGRKTDFVDFLSRTESKNSILSYEDWEFVADQNPRGAGDIIWAFYKEQGVKPDIPVDAESVIRHMVDTILDSGFDGIVVVLDEVSEYLAKSDNPSRDEDCLVYLSEQLTRTHKKPVWTFCAAQSKMETTHRKVIAENRLKEQNLLMSMLSYYDIILKRTRRIADVAKCDAHFSYYRERFSWVKELETTPLAREFEKIYHQADNLDGPELARRFFAYLFPYHPSGLDATKAVAFKLTTARAGIVVLYDALLNQLKMAAPANKEMVTPDRVFDQFESLSDGSNAIRSKFGAEYEAFERAKSKIQASAALSRARYKDDQPLRCLKVLMTAFLEDTQSPRHLSPADVADAVMVTWQDTSNAQDNKDFFEILLGKMASEIVQIKNSPDGNEYWFDPSSDVLDVQFLFERIKQEIAADPNEQERCWDTFLALDGLQVTRPNGMRRDFAQGQKCDFSDIANAVKSGYSIGKQVLWRGRWIKGIYRLGDLNKVQSLPPIETAKSDKEEDFVFILSRRPSHSNLSATLNTSPDPRYIFWEPADLTDAQKNTLGEWGAYLKLIDRYKERDSEDAEIVLKWVAERLPSFIPQMMSVTISAYGNGRVGSTNTKNHAFSYTSSGQLDDVITKVLRDVLDVVYESADIEFTGAQTLGDEDVTNVANSLVRFGEVRSPSGKDDKFTSAASNFGLGLQLVKPSSPNKLSLENSRYTKHIFDFIVDKAGSPLPMTLLYNNLMGIDGSTGKGYGLSKRLIQLYVLALVRDGLVKVTIKSGTIPDVTELDYSNISQVNFNSAVMNGLITVSVVEAPKDWDVVRKFIAIVIGKTIPDTRDEKEIKAYVEEFEDVYSEHAATIGDHIGKLDDFFRRINQPNGYAEVMGSWSRFFLSARGGSVEQKLGSLKSTLTNIFGLSLSDSTPETTDISTFQQSWDRYNNICMFLGNYAIKAQLGFEYIAELIPDIEQTKSLRTAMDKLKTMLMQQLTMIVENHTWAATDFLPAYDNALERYFDFYKIVHSEYYSKATEARKGIEAVSASSEANAVRLLDEVESLGSAVGPGLEHRVIHAMEHLPACEVQDYTTVKAHLSDKTTCKCLLHLSEAEQGIRDLAAKVASLKSEVNTAVVGKADVLLTDSVRNQIKAAYETLDDNRLKVIVDSDSSKRLAAWLVKELVENPGLVNLLKEILRQFRHVNVAWASLCPAQVTLEESDIQKVLDHVSRHLQSEFEKAKSCGAKVVVQLMRDESGGSK